ncbi:P-loop containing nucleoside triphosphate hydrolase protein [Dendrothele bispora CBS 962.96]|uniref:P-loop containing nucleoside triphosphate hydrolase protein n=1 Tax=Dendrothele bispora (strain CBS 962.96) TaxID=1314807 RepID=A0A4S8KYT8_DENBC|nr:P-loop containing nucleoside triphosphate hydrolase protein [Dendrothele bispora CBS 962.96]
MRTLQNTHRTLLRPHITHTCDRLGFSLSSGSFSTSSSVYLPRAVTVRRNTLGPFRHCITQHRKPPPLPSKPKGSRSRRRRKYEEQQRRQQQEKLQKAAKEVFKDPGKASLVANVRPAELPPVQIRKFKEEDEDEKDVADRIRRVFPAFGSIPEIIVTGRANSGKSSLFNAVVGRKDMIPTSNKAGRTRRLDFYRVGPTRDRQVILVDAPGYGERGRPEWGRLFDEYVKYREELRCVFITFNAKHALNEYDVQMLQHLTRSLLHDFRSRMFSSPSPPSSLSSPSSSVSNSRPRSNKNKKHLVTLQPVLTKADLLPKNQAEARKLIQKLKTDVREAVEEVVNDEIDAGVGSVAVSDHEATIVPIPTLTGTGHGGGERKDAYGNLRKGVKDIVDAILLEPLLTSVEMSSGLPFGIEEVRRRVVKSCGM